MDFRGALFLTIGLTIGLLISLGCEPGTTGEIDSLAPPESADSAAIESAADTTTVDGSKPVDRTLSESVAGGAEALAQESPGEALDAPEGPEPPPAPPLDDLLKLPDAVTDAYRDLVGRDPSRDAGDPETNAKRPAAGIRVEAEAREDSAGFDPKRQRRLREAEAGVAVDVDEGTSVRGGVRAQQQDDDAWTEPVPTVGIEKRF